MCRSPVRRCYRGTASKGISYGFDLQAKGAVMTLRRLALPAAVCALMGVAVMMAAEKAPAVMATAATRFLASLDADQKAKATFPFETDERPRWHYIPTSMFPRKGLMLRDMSAPQQNLARELLKTGMSARGYMTVTSIMELEDVLRAIEQGRGPGRDPLGYFFSIFGTPSASGTWGWRVDGHHVSLHFTIVQ